MPSFALATTLAWPGLACQQGCAPPSLPFCVQTRAHFLRAYGCIVDEPRVGADLADKYWRCGNGEMFLDLVHGLTGAPLTADAWVAHLQQPLDKLLEHERIEYEAALLAGPALQPGADVSALHMRVRLVHGDELLADSDSDGGFAAAAAKFKLWVRTRYFAGVAGGVAA